MITTLGFVGKTSTKIDLTWGGVGALMQMLRDTYQWWIQATGGGGGLLNIFLGGEVQGASSYPDPI